jgi:DNA-3-methyladenine glycosylase II
MSLFSKGPSKRADPKRTLTAKERHKRFLAIARELSPAGLNPALYDAIAQVGVLDRDLQGPIEGIEFTTEPGPFTHRLCRTVAGQQLSVKAAQSIWSRVLASAPQDANPSALMAYFATASPERLRACGLSGAKARTLAEIGQADLAGQLNSDRLRLLNVTARSQQLCTLWGVGQWTADMMNIFYFGEPDIWPDGDVAARKTLARLTSDRRKTTLTAARFAPYRSYLALYLWRYLDGPSQ